jgi:CRISPR/Cas system-associated exonuclease Cas4 (RecB family)
MNEAKDKVVTKAVDEHVEALEEERLPDGKWHPSSFWTCTRAAVMGHRGLPVTNKPDAQNKRVFRIGHMYHAFVQQALGLSPDFKAVYAEFGIEIDEWGIKGNGDVLVLFEDGHWEVFEIKSTKSLKYTPKDDHRKQASVYFTAARDFGFEAADASGQAAPYAPLGEKLTAIRLIYLNKADLEMKEYVYEYDPQWRVDIEERLAHLQSLADTDIEELPMLDPKDRSTSWFPPYCPYFGSGNCCGDPKGGWAEQVMEW